MFLCVAPSAYPYYTLALYKSKLNGATQWSWRWRRIEIPFDQIDKDRTLRQPLGKLLGIIIIYSISGEKILTLGLNAQEITEIMNSANEAER